MISAGVGDQKPPGLETSRRRVKQISPIQFFKKLRWLDGRPLLNVIEPYRQRLFERANATDENGIPLHNLGLFLRAKKNWKTGDLVLQSCYRLFVYRSPGGNQVYTLCNDEDQAGDDLELGKRFIQANPILKAAVVIKQNVIERKDGNGFWEILPAGDVVGTHGKTYSLAGFDEVHGYRNWDILEAMQLDPTRPDAMMWITSYNSIHHRPGVPLFDLLQTAWKGIDPRLVFSYYAADKTTDPEFENTSPEDKANPSRSSWQDKNYLEQQQRRLPSHKYRRLHLNLPGSPEGSAFNAERVMDAVEHGVRLRPPQPEITYCAFVDMSGGSSDDACLGIAHKDDAGKIILDRIVDQGQRPPFDPRKAVERFAKVLREYRVFTVTGDKYAGETFINDFAAHNIGYHVSELSKSELYESMEPQLNAGEIVLLDEPQLESQFLGLLWRGNKIDHASNEHDDWANAAGGVIWLVSKNGGEFIMPEAWGERICTDWNFYMEGLSELPAYGKFW